jgi:hypothetical protein
MIFKNKTKDIGKLNINEREKIIDNDNISLYEYINYNNQNIKLKDSFNNNESNYMNSSHKKSNNYNNNIYNCTNLESNNSTNSKKNLGNIIKFNNIK